MDARSKALYHQIHPAKLLTDWATAALACAIFWRHGLLDGLLVGLIPPVVASWALVRWADLEPYRASRLGLYVGRHMTRAMELLRLAGIVVVWVAAWRHSPALMILGLLVIVGAWSRGMLRVAKA
jgi:hypothetical protein